MKIIRRKNIFLLIVIFSSISLFSAGFASFLIPGGNFTSDTSNDIIFEVGEISRNISGVYINSSTFDGLKYTSDENLKYIYTKNTLDINLTVNKEELLINDLNSILNIELTTNTNFFTNVNYDSEFYICFDNNNVFKIYSSPILLIQNGISCSFSINSYEKYDLADFVNRFYVNENEVILKLVLTINSIPSTYEFNTLYFQTIFTYKANCEVN